MPDEPLVDDDVDEVEPPPTLPELDVPNPPPLELPLELVELGPPLPVECD